MIWIDGTPQPISFILLANQQEIAHRDGTPMRYNRGQRRRLERDFIREGREMARFWGAQASKRQIPELPKPLSKHPKRARYQRLRARENARRVGVQS